MRELLFKTKGQEKPDRKQKVYFMHHPDDFDQYFDRISDEILAISDCAIAYYKWEGERTVPLDRTRYEAELGEMRLFVLPITTNLLTRPCQAMEFEFRFALQHKIPVLPLMQEEGLAELFNQKCGDLQYLDKNIRDRTAIGYEEKLRNYLESVLLSDELADRVRASFAAYIFLSYRKKDRAYAQTLMHLIHQNDFCRDIAIWYDEFLNPGENFNDAIRDAIDKSKLFALAVTPNLLEEGNYVLEHEYPHALTADKPIMAVELQPTDHRQWKSQLGADAPALIGLQEQSQLKQALLNYLEDIAKKPRIDDPQHTFFIGLAYLSGIDVERNTDRALQLIRGAAEAGLTDAMKKLAKMYHNGEGVERDYREEIVWLEKLAAQAEERYRKTGDYEDGVDYFYQLWLLGDAWFDLRQVERASAVYQAQCELAEVLFKARESDFASRYLAYAFNNLGDAYSLRKQKRPALENYRKAFAIADRLAKETTDRSAQTLLANCYVNLGDAYFNVFRFGKSKQCYKKYLTIRKALAEETGSTQDRRALARAYDEVAELSGYSAVRYHEMALDIRIELVKEQNTLDARWALADSYAKLGYWHKWLSKRETAEWYYRRALEIREEYDRERNTVRGRTALAESCYDLGTFMKDRQLVERAYFIYCELSEQCPEVWFYSKRRDWAEKKLNSMDS
ncbi:MAG: toll/interleukin-1 receptor domain-containing protein [Clostridia bacterium]|nr:toll/interleukin-1 receptor domain-containing protein [Clostridia bacterium]